MAATQALQATLFKASSMSATIPPDSMLPLRHVFPLVSIFAGFANERMFHRWRPTTPNAQVIPIHNESREASEPQVLDLIRAAVAAVPTAGQTG